MSTFILVHGAWHGAWCWDKVAATLEQRGHWVIAPDLPAHGQDRTPIAEVTLAAYADRVAAVLEEQAEPVVLVGHSMGGTVISEAAERQPNKVRALVYLCAFLLRDGESLLQVASQDNEGLVLPNLEMSPDQSSATVRREALKEVFYADCSDADVERAKALLVPQAAAAFMTPIHVTEQRWGRIPRTYVECLLDRAIPIALQRGMVAATPVQRVITMDTSHSPFFSAPQALAEHLLSV